MVVRLLRGGAATLGGLGLTAVACGVVFCGGWVVLQILGVFGALGSLEDGGGTQVVADGVADPEDVELSDTICEVHPYRTIARGTIQNTTDHPQAYRLTIRFGDDTRRLVPVFEVQPGDLQIWTSTTKPAAPTCAVDVVRLGHEAPMYVDD